MIYTTGTVTIIDEPNSKALQIDKKSLLTLTYIKEEKLDLALMIQYTFAAFLPKDYHCKSLEDYTGKIKPFIEKETKKRVRALQVKHLNYVSDQTARRLMREKSKS